MIQPNQKDLASSPLVSVGIVNWNGGEMLLACLRSLFAQSHHPIEVVLVDNASADGSATAAESDFPDLRVVRNPDNRGYAASQNQALGLCGGEYYMALNPDVILEPDYVAQLVEGLAQHPDAGYAIGKIRVLERDGSKTEQIYSTGHLFPRNRRGYNRGIDAADSGEWDQPEIIPGANGSCPLYRMEMVRDLQIDGMFWENLFFMYGDDLDVDWRAALRGWKCLYWPPALAYHVGSGTGGLRRNDIYAMFVAHRYLMVLKNDRLADLLRDLPWFLRATLGEMIGLAFCRPAVFFGTLCVFFAKTSACLRRRRVIQSRRTHSARPWFALSLRLIRQRKS